MFSKPILTAAAAIAALQGPGGDRPLGEDAALPFEPFAVTVSADIQSQWRAGDCAVRIEGDPAPHWLDNACRNFTRPEFLRGTGVGATDAGRVTALLWLATGAKAEGQAAAGRRLFLAEALFSVAPDGTISRCEPGETVGTGTRFPLCDLGFPDGATPFEAVLPDEALRSGRLSLALYLEP